MDDACSQSSSRLIIVKSTIRQSCFRYLRVILKPRKGQSILGLIGLCERHRDKKPVLTYSQHQLHTFATFGKYYNVFAPFFARTNIPSMFCQATATILSLRYKLKLRPTRRLPQPFTRLGHMPTPTVQWKNPQDLLECHVSLSARLEPPESSNQTPKSHRPRGVQLSGQVDEVATGGAISPLLVLCTSTTSHSIA